MTRLFADTYALIELLKENPNYEEYSQADLVATEFNIFELTYALFRDFGRNLNIKNYRLCELQGRSYIYREF